MYIIALSTDGTETQRGLKCIKASTNNCTPAILLHLFRATARNMTPRRASYSYIHLPTIQLIHGFLVLCLTEAEKTVVEGLTRPYPLSPDVYWWKENAWYEFPCQLHSDYCPTSTTNSRTPRFLGDAAPFLSPSGAAPTPPIAPTGQPTPGTLHARRSQHDPKKPAWWWISGDTKPQHDILDAGGAHWSRKRQEWYYIGDALPPSIQALIANPADLTPAVKLDSALLDRAFEVAVRDDPVELARQQIQAALPAPQIGESVPVSTGLLPSATPPQVVLAKPCRRLPLPPFGRDRGTELLPAWLSAGLPGNGMEYDSQGRPLVWVKLFMPDGNWYLFISNVDHPRRRVMCYAVLNYDFQMAEWGWQYLEDLEAVRGTLRLPMERDTSFTPQSLDEALARFKRERGLDDDAPRSTTFANVSDEPVIPFQVKTLTTPDEAVMPMLPDIVPPEPMIRVIKPDIYSTTEPLDPIQQAVQQTKTTLSTAIPAPSTPTAKHTALNIAQAYVGELTGNISGNVHCYGYAVQDGILVYLNMGGPRMAVEAIRAKLGRGEIVNLSPWDGPSEELTAGEKQTGCYTAFIANMPEAKFTSMILVHEMLITPSYGGKSTTFILRTNEAQAMAKLHHHITALVNVPVFDEWTNYLWQAGQAAMLVRRTRSGGGIDLWTITLDVDSWTRLITGGLAQEIIALPVRAQ